MINVENGMEVPYMVKWRMVNEYGKVDQIKRRISLLYRFIFKRKIRLLMREQGGTQRSWGGEALMYTKVEQ